MTSDDARTGDDRAASGYAPAMFLPHVGSTFDVDADTGRVPLRLAGVSEARTSGGFLRFSIEFHGPPERGLAQGMYAFHHDTLGALPLFIVPVVGSNAERILYEACFSVPVTTAGAP